MLLFELLKLLKIFITHLSQRFRETKNIHTNVLNDKLQPKKLKVHLSSQQKGNLTVYHTGCHKMLDKPSSARGLSQHGPTDRNQPLPLLPHIQKNTLKKSDQKEGIATFSKQHLARVPRQPGPLEFCAVVPHGLICSHRTRGQSGTGEGILPVVSNDTPGNDQLVPVIFMQSHSMWQP